MNNYKLIIQYDGTKYSGWQIQKNAPSIQGAVVDSIKKITGEDVNLIGSGRTDAGVHAFGQAANFISETELDIQIFNHSLNAVLPFDISVSKIEKVNESFHSRFDAKKRSYIYQISKIKSPFYHKYSYYYPQINSYDLIKLNLLSKLFIGEKDFTSLSKKNPELENKICTIFRIEWRDKQNIVSFFIEADRFLHGMVRTIVGTILRAVKHANGEAEIINVLKQNNREAAGESVPARGLFLLKVRY